MKYNTYKVITSRDQIRAATGGEVYGIIAHELTKLTSIESVLKHCIEGFVKSRNTKKEFITQRSWRIIELTERIIIKREYTLKDIQLKRGIRD